MGFDSSDDPAKADVVVLNTCVVRQSAEDTATGMLGRLAKIKRQSPAQLGPMVAVMGCMVGPDQSELRRRFPQVDIWARPQQFAPILESAGIRHGLDPEGCLSGAVPLNPHVASFVPIVHGCDKFCTYCVVPYTRGAEISRPFAELVAEAQRLVEGGARELTLLGQNVSAWSGEDAKGHRTGLAGLVRELAKIDGLARIRYTTSHPADMDEEIIAAHGEVDKLMPFLHLPVQAGNNRVLKAMNRSHTVESYLRLLERFRAARPDLALSGDFIVGFPGETEAEFEDTLKVVDEVRYAQAFSFKYSPRPGTPAAGMDGQVAADVMKDRLARLQDRLNRDQHAFNIASVGRTCEVLVERKGKLPGQWLGKSPWLQSVFFEDEGIKIGDLVQVTLAEAGPNSLRGAPVRVQAPA